MEPSSKENSDKDGKGHKGNGTKGGKGHMGNGTKGGRGHKGNGTKGGKGHEGNGTKGGKGGFCRYNKHCKKPRCPFIHNTATGYSPARWNPDDPCWNGADGEACRNPECHHYQECTEDGRSPYAICKDSYAFLTPELAAVIHGH